MKKGGSRKYLVQSGRRGPSRPGTAFLSKTGSVAKLNSMGSTTYNTTHNTTSQTLNNTTFNTNSNTPHHTAHHTAVLSPTRKFSSHNQGVSKTRNPMLSKKKGVNNYVSPSTTSQGKAVGGRKSQRMSIFKGGQPRNSIKFQPLRSSKFGMNEESEDEEESHRNWVRDGDAKMTQKIYHHTRYRPDESLDEFSFEGAHESKEKEGETPPESKHYFISNHRRNSSSQSFGDRNSR